jgi:UDP-N-acetylglucosamine acyltransferase
VRGVHPSAIVDPAAELASDVTVGPFAVIEADVRVGEGSRIGAHAVLQAGARLGRRVQVSPHAVLAGLPQDLGFGGEPSTASIGDDTVVREYVSVHRSSKPGGETRIGRGCLLMALSHVGHDCQIGDAAILTSYAGLSGHIQVGERAVIGGQAGLHQHVRVGRLAMVAGKSRVVKDVPPFVIAEGNPCRVRGLNLVGLRRADLDPETRERLKRAFRLLYRSELNTAQALEAIRREIPSCEPVEDFVRFVESSERGIAPGPRGEEEIGEE